MIKRRLTQLKKRHEQEVDRIKHYAEYYQGIDMSSELARLFYLVHLLRRIALVMIALQLDIYPGIQLIAVLVLCLGHQIYLLQVQIFRDRFYYVVDVFNDYFVYLATIHAVVILTVSYDLDTQDLVGTSLVAVVLIGLAINLVIILRGMCIDAKRNLVKRYTLTKIRAHTWDKSCDCAC